MKVFVGIILVYMVLMLKILPWGLPGPDHPFTYHMDEWHQLQAVRAVFRYGSPNIPGAANGTMFFFIQAGVWLIPFNLMGQVNPFLIKSSVSSLPIWHELFVVFRLNTLLYGIFSIILIAKISKEHFKVNPWVATFFFTISPIWLMLSNYFKYDVSLVFWITLSIYITFKFARSPTLKNYVLLGVVNALALAVKVSGIPLLLIYLFSFYYFTPRKTMSVKDLVLGLIAFISVFVLLGIPDVVLGKGSYYEYLHSNLVSGPSASDNYVLGSSWWLFLLTSELSVVFGHFTYLVFVFCFFILIFNFRGFRDKEAVFLLVSLIIILLSLVPLKLSATGNRLLVLLPYLSLLAVVALDRLYKSMSGMTKKLILPFFLIGTAFQLVETYSWVTIKLNRDPRAISSEWMTSNIRPGSIIGIENIPIYQMLPDITLKEFYSSKSYGAWTDTIYKYEIIDSNIRQLPQTVVVSDPDVAIRYFKQSPKKDLVLRLRKEGFNETKIDTPREINKIFVKDINFHLSGLVATPLSISIFTKQI